MRYFLLERAQSDEIDFLAVYDDDQLIGFTYLIHYLDVVYVFYLTVTPVLRNRG